MSSPSFRTSRDFTPTAAMAMAVAVAVIVGCGSKPDLPLGQPFCVEGRWSPLGNLDPVTQADYVGEYRGVAGNPLNVVTESGVLCASATDHDACVSNATAPTGFPPNNACDPAGNCTHYLVTTLGDDVRFMTTVDQLAAFFGEIDTPDEAALLVAFARYTLYSFDFNDNAVCGDPADAGAAATADGFELVATQYTKSCAPIELSRLHLHVSRAGQIDVTGAQVIERSPACF